MDVQHRDSTLWVSADGNLDAEAGMTLGRVLEEATAYERVLMVDLHGVVLMDRDGLLHLLDLHRRAEGWGLRVLVVGWRPQPQQLMADVAGIRGPGSATGERYALAGFRRLIEERAHQARHLADNGTGWMPGP
ncbi:STAS domain-containing protein [Streptomyces sp. NPDC006512]|uniref:STAS domain-containing protein n=1 Tax=Streptomyces sp. NPDC006512 TaxID=3154307 RepID=UPI0033B999F4